MPPLAEHQSAEFTKMILMGDSSSGKTSALISLIRAGYWLGILDFDNGLDPLKQLIKKRCPELMGNVEYRTLSDKVNTGPAGPTITPYAFAEGLKMLNHWKYKDGDKEYDYGVPATWGPKKILVIDSLTFFSEAAFQWTKAMNPGTKDGRMIYFFAQDAIEKSVLSNFKSEAFRTNVIVICHLKYIERPDGTTKGYPTTVGSALSPQVPTYFNSAVMCLTKPGGVRTIQLASSALVDLKNPALLTTELPIETGLAEFFKQVRS